jgi:hypothetical protein
LFLRESFGDRLSPSLQAPSIDKWRETKNGNPEAAASQARHFALAHNAKQHRRYARLRKMVTVPHCVTTTSMIERLPPDLMTKILEFVDLQERLQPASCSTTLLKLITRDCTTLWEVIDFHPHAPWRPIDRTQSQIRHALTDDMLAALLKRVNAQNMTKYLSIQCCPNIRGGGLLPLRHSSVLERVNLHNTHSIRENEVMDILRTTLPFKLFDVMFTHLKVYSEVDSTRRACSEQRAKFLREMRMARLQQAQEQSIKCNDCRQSVSDKFRQLVPNFFGVPPTRCLSCHNHFCRKGSCSTGMLECEICGDASCEACDAVRRCSECASSYCGDCEYVSPCCTFCNKAFCNNGCVSDVRTCVDCNKTACDSCEQGQAISIMFLMYVLKQPASNAADSVQRPATATPARAAQNPSNNANSVPILSANTTALGLVTTATRLFATFVKTSKVFTSSRTSHVAIKCYAATAANAVQVARRIDPITTQSAHTVRISNNATTVPVLFAQTALRFACSVNRLCARGARNTMGAAWTKGRQRR